MEVKETGYARDVFAIGSPGCECPRCHRLFTKPYAFDMHLQGKPGKTWCAHPRNVGLSDKITAKGYRIWFKPLDSGKIAPQNWRDRKEMVQGSG